MKDGLILIEIKLSCNTEGMYLCALITNYEDMAKKVKVFGNFL